MSVLKLGEWEEGSAWEFFPLNPVSLRRPLSKLHQHQINFVCFVWTNGNRGERGNRPMGGSQQLVSMVHLGCVEEARNYCHDLQWICWISLQLQVLSEKLRGHSKSPVRWWPACEGYEVRKGTTFWEALDCLESLPWKKNLLQTLTKSQVKSRWLLHPFESFWRTQQSMALYTSPQPTSLPVVQKMSRLFQE